MKMMVSKRNHPPNKLSKSSSTPPQKKNTSPYPVILWILGSLAPYLVGKYIIPGAKSLPQYHGVFSRLFCWVHNVRAVYLISLAYQDSQSWGNETKAGKTRQTTTKNRQNTTDMWCSNPQHWWCVVDDTAKDAWGLSEHQCSYENNPTISYKHVSHFWV